MFVLAASEPTSADTWHVIETYGGTPSGGHGSATNPYTGSDAIQKAIDGASSGDTIKVGGGTYLHIQFPALASPPVDLVVIHDNSWSIHAYSSGDAIIDGTGSTISTGVTINGGQTENTVFQGFFVKNWSPAGGGSSGGCGIRVAPTPNWANGTGCSPVIKNCTIIDNLSNPGTIYGGAGMQIAWNCHPEVRDCTFDSNALTDSTGYGGGLWIYGASISATTCGEAEYPNVAEPPDPLIIDCTFLGNTATQNEHGAGGAIAITCGKGTIIGCTFEGNEASRGGGAIYGKIADGTLIEDCTFQDENTADFGGAIYFEGIASDDGLERVHIIGCTFMENIADDTGGAIFVKDKDATVSHSIFEGNHAEVSTPGLWFEGARDISGTPGETQNPYTAIVAGNLFGPAHTIGSTHSQHKAMVYCLQDVDSERVECVFTNNTVTGNSDLRGITLNNIREDAGEILTFLCQNSILYFNSDSLTDISIHDFDKASVLTVAYTDAEQEVFSGTGNISDDPEFIGSPPYSLDNGSPCLDVASNAYWSAVLSADGTIPNTDLEGEDRIVDSVINMGCYEGPY